MEKDLFDSLILQDMKQTHLFNLKGCYNEPHYFMLLSIYCDKYHEALMGCV